MTGVVHIIKEYGFYRDNHFWCQPTYFEFTPEYESLSEYYYLKMQRACEALGEKEPPWCTECVTAYTLSQLSQAIL